ncbi:MAG TPA: PTS sugar transporter subunit IIA [Polyangiaceae bacterium]|nr:PTS sugar transporter subunit IIA [Polyangiaceae bacterium]
MKLTVRDAASLLHVSERDVYRWIREGSIPVQKVHERYRFHRAELLEWATTRGIRVASKEFETPSANGAAMPHLADALKAGGVHRNVPGPDRPSVLRAVVERMPIEATDRDLVCDFLLAREALGSTGVGEGIAIPHVRNPIVLHVDRASVTLCFLEQPVDFDAIDGKPVDTVFSLVSPTIRGHLFLLSRIAAALHDEPFKQAILRRQPEEEILRQARRMEGSLPPPKGAAAE